MLAVAWLAAAALGVTSVVALLRIRKGIAATDQALSGRLRGRKLAAWDLRHLRRYVISREFRRRFPQLRAWLWTYLACNLAILMLIAGAIAVTLWKR